MNCNFVNLGLGGGKLYQFANRSPIQMMSYLLESADGRFIMIDGGNICDPDADFLYETLASKGGHISAWFITHAHDDHFGALSILLGREGFDLKIDCMYYDFPDNEWFKTVENGSSYKQVCEFTERVAARGLRVERLERGQIFDFGIKIEVLNSLGDYSAYHTVNDTSIVLKAHYPNRAVLFLGDLALEGQKTVLAEAGEKLRCDIVQMAHHGQNGVDFDMYKFIGPKVCLYCAPDWLWNNDKGDGFDSGPWGTVKTRKWMDEIGAVASFPSAYGDYIFD